MSDYPAEDHDIPDPDAEGLIPESPVPPVLEEGNE